MVDPSRAPGTQTLARGLRALQLVSTAADGLSVQEVAGALDVHRSIASRLLSTLADFHLVTRGGDGRYRTGTGLAALAAGIHATLRAAADPVLHELAAELGATVSLLVVEGGQAVALSVVEPPGGVYRLSFRTGSRHPLGRGSAGVALLAAQAPSPGEAASVTEARERGFAATFGEVEPGAYGVAVPLVVEGLPVACLNLITSRAEIAGHAAPALVAAAERLRAGLA
ncbi:transcriptional regulator [Streptomyces hygroscopicus subsp. hygroscopicus]|uniref:IclR family transcriptional regulator n=1 Tax=Streptomyces sp. KHY 26 TaxID=3097359 RepID=UPI0024A3BD63|nr:helix-turn-helix domain-containing protein [Streptomyces hygroscopicus]GLX49662.1 transcriptional regulator [Streptomyces hygroscopicus subsp. hygroscopicus]